MQTTDRQSLDSLLEAVRACRAGEARLPLGPRPVLQASVTARVLKPLNVAWFRANPWFDTELLPVLRRTVARFALD